jgi:hypothetical protein
VREKVRAAVFDSTLRARVSVLGADALSSLLAARCCALSSVSLSSHMWLFPVDANPLDDGTYSQPQMFADSKMR